MSKHGIVNIIPRILYYREKCNFCCENRLSNLGRKKFMSIYIRQVRANRVQHQETFYVNNYTFHETVMILKPCVSLTYVLENLKLI